MDALLEVKGIRKYYGAVKALIGVDLKVRPGEVLAICGDNGAGKSTLIRIVSGAETQTQGSLFLRGEKVEFQSPADALRKGVATIYQDLALAPRLTIYQNVYMGAELLKNTFLPMVKVLDKPQMKKLAAGYLSRLNVTIQDLEAPVNTLSGGQRQAVAISRALRWNAELVIMDEPTAALGVKETAQVLELIRQLNKQGVTVILISHNMKDVVSVATRVAIIKGGLKVGECTTEDLTPEELSNMVMTGNLGDKNLLN
ncbi:ATP-binding cassette domain-containing protein [Dethiosulfatarculus sandiegensis]|uniref:ABC transporter ATP-binding protein n=1 Tax=Dethiosulfatarculus sandiegensis TaxID=1429043 RepID=A0A0D2JAJ0_9BACT|nr:ATP-binding cassette domain-containing protein [Dethiosulfatarculus sandiegensis]KIX12746.1 ABC transporter ATP-binding protein [Dethiosulfatarculus sandiegensis]